MARPAAASIDVYRHFAASRRWHDVFQAITTVTVVAVFILVRTLESSICAADYPHPAAPDAALEGFPCTEPSGKVLWVTRRMLWLPAYLSITYGFAAYFAFLIADGAVGVVALLQPRWYLGRGRSVFLSSIRFGVKLLTLLELALRPPNPINLAWVEACYVGNRGLLILCWDCFLCPIPLRTHIPVAASSWALAVALNAVHHRHRHGTHPPIPAFLLTAGSLCIFGLILPTLLLAALEAPSRASARRTAPAATRPSKPSRKALPPNAPTPAAGEGSSACAAAPSELPSTSTPTPPAATANLHDAPPTTTATTPELAPAIPRQDAGASPAAPPPPACSPGGSAAQAAGVDAAGPAPEQPPPPAARPESAAAADAPPSHLVTVSRGGVTATAVPAAAQADSQGGLRMRAPYRGSVTTTVVSVKIHHHGAYEMRSSITSSIQEQLLTSFGPDCPLTVTAFPGCLQLVLTLHAGAPARPPADLHQLAQRLHSSLPPEARSQNVSVQVGQHLVTLRPAAAAGGRASPSLVAPPSLAQEVSLVLEPLCLTAGDAAAAVEIQVEGQGVLGSECKLVLVGSCGGRGVHCSALLPAGTLLPASRRLQLPAALDAGPAAAHLVSQHPSHPGALLATTTTAALPPAAALELAAALAAQPGGATFAAGLRTLLRDLAAAWRLPHAAAPAAGHVPPHPLVAGVLEYLRDSDLPHLAAAFAARTGAAAPGPAAASGSAGAQRGALRRAAAGALRAAVRRAVRLKGRVSPTVHATYARWRSEQSRRLDLVAAAGFVLLGAVVAALQATLRGGGGGGGAVAGGQLQATLALHVVLLVAPPVVLALGGPRLRAWRGAVMLVQAVARGVLLVGASGTAAQAAWWRGFMRSTPRLLITAVLVPLLKQAPWQLQVLLTALEELCSIPLCAHSPATCPSAATAAFAGLPPGAASAAPLQRALASSRPMLTCAAQHDWLRALLLVAASGATSALVEVWSWRQFLVACSALAAATHGQAATSAAAAGQPVLGGLTAATGGSKPTAAMCY